MSLQKCASASCSSKIDPELFDQFSLRCSACRREQSHIVRDEEREDQLRKLKGREAA